jgi:hypothetical protein
MLGYYKTNKVVCKKCGDILFAAHENEFSNNLQMLFCKCGAVAMDPGALPGNFRICGLPCDYEDLSEWCGEE